MGKKKAASEDALNEHGLNPRQELFCQYYVSNGDTFANATLSYGEAYDFKLEELSKWAAKDENESEYDRVCNTCAANGNRLLRNAKVRARVTVLLNALLKDEIVDSELAKLIQQDTDFPTKVRSIAEYNKLRGRIIDKTQQVTIAQAGERSLEHRAAGRTGDPEGWIQEQRRQEQRLLEQRRLEQRRLEQRRLEQRLQEQRLLQLRRTRQGARI